MFEGRLRRVWYAIKQSSNIGCAVKKINFLECIGTDGGDEANSDLWRNILEILEKC